MMASPVQPAVFSAWLEASRRNRGTDRFRVSLVAFRAIARGRAVSAAELAEAAAMEATAVEQTLRALVDEGRLMRNSAGTITGAGGLSLAGGRHALTLYGRRYGVWCALDAVGIPAGLDADARVESVCEDTGEAVAIDIVSGSTRAASPAGVCLSLVAPTLDRPLFEGCCSRIGFYADTARVPADATACTPGQGADLGRELWRDGIPL